MAAGVLFSEMDPGPDHQNEFDDWYEATHIPARLAIDGFSHAFRSIRLGAGTRNSACYLIGDMAALDSPEYRLLKDQPDEQTRSILASSVGFTRFTGVLTGGYGNPSKDTSHVMVSRGSEGTQVPQLLNWIKQRGASWSGIYRVTSASDPDTSVLAIGGFLLSAEVPSSGAAVPEAVIDCGVFELTHWASR